jgi:hypothetical protein
MGFFDFLIPSGTLKKVADFAEGTGLIKIPLTSEIKSLEDKLAVLKGFKFRLSDVTRNQLPRLARTQPQVAADLKRQIAQADAQAAATVRLINVALSDGRAAQEKIKYGGFAPKPTASFLLKKQIADRTFSLAKTRYDQAWAVWTLAQRQMFSAGNLPVYRQVGGAAYSTIREAGGKMTRALVSTGKAAEEAIIGAGALAPYAKYVVPVGLAFVGLYAFSMLPKPRKD